MLIQEEIDFSVYVAFGVADASLLADCEVDELCGVSPGQRPFCILQQSNQDGFPVPRDVPYEWPEKLRTIWRNRIVAIKNSPELCIIEDANYKRRWIGRQGKYNHVQNADEGLIACKEWMLDRLEQYFDFDGRMNDSGRCTSQIDICLVSLAGLSDIARQDSQFVQVGEFYRKDVAYDLQSLVAELVLSESVPLLQSMRYKPSGTIKRATWERAWRLQREDDERAIGIDAERHNAPSTCVILEPSQQQPNRVETPTKYESKDFLDSNLWRLRGKFDVPKERWISFPHCEGPDGTLVICWAGYDHLQQAQAISAYYVRVQTDFGGSDDPRLIPLLASLIELLPWLKQWHNEPNANFDGLRMGDYFEGFVNEEARNLGKTIAEIKAWVPPKKAGKTIKIRRSSKFVAPIEETE